MGLKRKTPMTGLKLVAIVLLFSNKKISKDFTIQPHIKLVTLGNKFDPMAITYMLFVKAHWIKLHTKFGSPRP